MNRFILLFTVFLLLVMSFESFAQKLDVEKTYEITGKSKRGQLANVEVDKNTGNYILTYITKSNDKMAKFQIYTFDKDFNFVNMTEDEIEFEKAKSKYSWFKWRGELYSVEGLFVEPNLVGTLVLKRKRITYKYDWLWLGYYKEVEILEKVKPKNEEGDKYFYIAHSEDETTGDVYVLCGIKEKIKKDGDPMRHQKDLHILKFNKDIDLIKDLPIKFDYPQSLAFTRTIDWKVEEDPDNPGVGGLVFVFAPTGGMGLGKYADPEMCNYTYVKVDKDLNLVDRIPFKSYASYWKIDELIYNEKDVYLYGPSAAGKEKYFNVAATDKFKAVQLMKITDHKIDYFTETKLEEFESKLKTPPSQKKSPEYKGKKFDIGTYAIVSAGDFFVFGQNFDLSSDNQKKFKDILGFQFDTKGVLKTQYGIDTKESNKHAKAAGAPQFTIEGSDQKSLFWFIQEITGVAAAKNKVLSYPRIARLDVGSGTIGDFMDFGGEEYYLDPKFPYLQTTKGNTVVFFGANKSGKKIWFARVKLE